MSYYSDLKLPFGQTASGRMVRPDEVERGIACGCVCPGCGAPLIAKQGGTYRHHFAHTAEACASGGLESALHKMAKQVLATAQRVWAPAYIAVCPPWGFPSRFRGSHRICEGHWLAGTCATEVSVGDIRPDVLLSTEAGALAVEICVSHAVDDEKREKIEALKLPTLGEMAA